MFNPVWEGKNYKEYFDAASADYYNFYLKNPEGETPAVGSIPVLGCFCKWYKSYDSSGVNDVTGNLFNDPIVP